MVFLFFYIIYVYNRVYHRKYIEPECAGYRNQDFPAVLFLFYFILLIPLVFHVPILPFLVI